MKTSLFRHNSHVIKFTHLKCKIQWLLVHSELHNYHHNVIFEHLHTFQQPLLILPNTWPLATTNPLFVSLDLPILDISYKQKHTICLFLCDWLSLKITFSRLIHMVARIIPSSFFLIKNYACIYMPHFVTVVHSFICWWASGLFLLFDYYEYYYYKHGLPLWLS